MDIVIDGMHCDGCVAKVKDALAAVAAVRDAEVAVGSARVAFDESAGEATGVIAAVRKAGFAVKSFKSSDRAM
jgi:copper chaperone CopZ